MLLSLSASGPVSAQVTPGLDRLVELSGASLRDQRIGLITNHTGQTVDGRPALEVLRDELGLDLRALFSPEHGFTGTVAAGDEVASTRLAETGLPIHSLYGATRKPTPEMLEGLDLLVFDIQDLGVRFYTYISTLKLAMEAAASEGLRFVVLDRPNPNGGLRVEGPMLSPAFESFVGVTSIPLLHGMTVGELSRLFKESIEAESGVTLKLDVVPAEGYRRAMSWEDTGLPWRATSPNIRTLESAIAYPAIGLFEGANLSEGRGTEETFLKAGAPWIEVETLLARLRERGLPGLSFRPASFTPRSIPAAPRPKYPDQLCRGFEIRVQDRERFEAVRTGLTLLAEIRELHPAHFQWQRSEEGYWIDKLLGTSRPREAMERGETVDEILRSEASELESFLTRREAYLIYR